MRTKILLKSVNAGLAQRCKNLVRMPFPTIVDQSFKISYLLGLADYLRYLEEQFERTEDNDILSLFEFMHEEKKDIFEKLFECELKYSDSFNMSEWSEWEARITDYMEKFELVGDRRD